jgi:hypothetical protein
MGRSGPGKDLPDSPLVRAVVSATEIACLSEAARRADAALERVMLARAADGGRWGGALGPLTGVGHAGRGRVAPWSCHGATRARRDACRRTSNVVWRLVFHQQAPGLFAGKLRSTSSNPVVYAELPGAQQSFDLFRSVRFEKVVDAIEVFAGWLRSRESRARVRLRAPWPAPHTRTETHRRLTRVQPGGVSAYRSCAAMACSSILAPNGSAAAAKVSRDGAAAGSGNWRRHQSLISP